MSDTTYCNRCNHDMHGTFEAEFKVDSALGARIAITLEQAGFACEYEGHRWSMRFEHDEFSAYRSNVIVHLCDSGFADVWLGAFKKRKINFGEFILIRTNWKDLPLMVQDVDGLRESDTKVSDLPQEAIDAVDAVVAAFVSVGAL